MFSGGISALLVAAFAKWSDHGAARLGAALAFYTLLSLAPLLIFTILIVAFVFGQAEAQQRILEQVQEIVGPYGAKAVHALVEDAHNPASGAVAGAIGLLTLLFGASGVFIALRDALNIIWDIKPAVSGAYGWNDVMKDARGLVKQRIFSFAIVLAIGFLLLASLILSAALAAIGKFFSEFIPFPALILQAMNFVFSFSAITCLFALIFRYVPDARIPWRNIWIGSVVTAFLFTIGKFLLGLYLGIATVVSAYGAAGSIVAVVVWVYYSAQIFFFGAEVTRLCANSASVVTACPPDRLWPFWNHKVTSK
jgi:membrane protein